MPEQLKDFINKLNSKGIPVPLFRDPKTGVGSISFSLVIISGLFVAAGLIGKLAKSLEGIDASQALGWFIACSSLYMGRSLTTKNVKSESESNDKTERNDPQ